MTSIISPTQQIPIRIDASEPRVEISWNINLPDPKAFRMIRVNILQDDDDVTIALRTDSDGSKLILTEEVPQEYESRISTSENGIIISPLDFEMDHGQRFNAILIYKSKYNRLASITTRYTELLLRYRPEYVNFTSQFSVIENMPGERKCLVKSYPEASKVEWVVGRADFQYTQRTVILTPEQKSKYGFQNTSKLVYKLAILNYGKIPRNSQATFSCDVTTDMGERMKQGSRLNVLYATDPPVELKVQGVSDTKVDLSWLGPSPQSGNPNKVLYYTVELLKSSPKSPSAIRDSTSSQPDDGSHTDSSNVDETTTKLKSNWIIYNISKESATLYNLEPNTLYLVRVKSYNGIEMSDPSDEITFKTEISRNSPPPKFAITQPILIAIISSATIFVLLLMLGSVVCVVKLRRKRIRTWAVFNRKNSNSRDQPPPNNNDKVLVNSHTPNYTDVPFADLPPFVLDQNQLNKYRNRPDFQHVYDDSSSVSEAPPQDTISHRSQQMRPSVQTQIATKYLPEGKSSTSINKSYMNDIKVMKENGTPSVSSNRSAFV